MLKISKEQIKVLQNKKAEEFCKTALKYLDEFYPHELSLFETEDEQLEWISEVVTSAYDYNLQAEREVYSYLRAAITFDEDFHTLPWAKGIFDLKVAPSTKALLLDDAVTDQLDSEASELKIKNEKLANEKLEQYSKEKAEYVYSFNAFYGLGLTGSSEARQWVLESVSKAYEFGIIEDIYLDSYLEITMHFGREFYRKSWARKILESEGSVNTKVKALLTFLSKNYGNTDA